MIRRLLRSTRGAAAVEFAMVAPLLIVTVMSVMEAGRIIWTRQVVQQTAFASARCIGLRGTGCDTDANTRSFAVTRARRSGIKLTAAMVTVTSAPVACAGQTQMRRVDIALPYKGLAAPLMKKWNGNLTATSCFPIITT